MTRAFAFVLIAIAGGTAIAEAQPRRPATAPPPRRLRPAPLPKVDRGYITVGGALQVSPTTFSDSAHPLDFAERATVDTRFHTNGIPGFDIGGGLITRRKLSLGASLSYFQKSANGDIAAQIPHPFTFNRFRPVSGAADLSRRETAVHVQAIWPAAVYGHWQLSIGGGPSVFHVSQALVDNVDVAQTYPYDTATFASAVVERGSKIALGLNAAAFADRAVNRTVGVRMTLGYSYAGLRLEAADGRTTAVRAGGLRVGGNLVWKF